MRCSIYLNRRVSVMNMRSLYFQTEQLVFLSVLFAMIVIGNTLVLMAIVVSGKRRSRMNVFIINLACAGKI